MNVSTEQRPKKLAAEMLDEMKLPLQTINLFLENNEGILFSTEERDYTVRKLPYI